MKAVVYSRFGGPEVLHIKEVSKPVPHEEEVLVRIRATTVEREDPMMRKSPGLNGIFKPKKAVLGMELAGEIEAVGPEVTRFKPGDKVYGNAGLAMGTYAQYICLHQDSALVKIPSGMNYEQAAAVTNGALTALHFLKYKADIQPGQPILINGASGSVGVAAVQLAKYFGAEVTGVCSKPKLQLVKDLGAKDVIDYIVEDFTAKLGQYDIIFDVAAKSKFGKCKKLLTEKGIYLTTMPSPGILLGMLISAKGKGKRIGTGAVGLKKPKEKALDLEIIKQIIELGQLKAVIDRVYPLEEIAEAHRYVENNHKTGSVVIKV